MTQQLAISLDEDNAKAYGTGSGSTTKFPVPLTTMIAREIWNYKGPGADSQKIDDAIKVCRGPTEIVASLGG